MQRGQCSWEGWILEKPFGTHQKNFSTCLGSDVSPGTLHRRSPSYCCLPHPFRTLYTLSLFFFLAPASPVNGSSNYTAAAFLSTYQYSVIKFFSLLLLLSFTPLPEKSLFPWETSLIYRCVCVCLCVCLGHCLPSSSFTIDGTIVLINSRVPFVLGLAPCSVPCSSHFS